MTTLRPRVLCVHPRLNPQAGPILVATTDEWVEALRLHADVHTVEEDFDLAALCEAIRPDLIVLDALHWARPWALAITNPRSHPEIPRVLFNNADPHDPMRPLTLRMADAVGVEAMFIVGDGYLQHMPELRHMACYLVPHFVDETVYRDDAGPRTIPLSVFGAHFMPAFYPWRARLLADLRAAIPTLAYPHPGYQKDRAGPFAVYGAAYVRVLNRSLFSAADTTRLDYVVRKHVEIPAAGAILVAPASPALEAYGFLDMENCILGDGPELAAKLSHVARTPADYARIRGNGMALVQSRYTRHRWRHMLDWLACRSGLQPGETVQQDGYYGPFRRVRRRAETPTVVPQPRATNAVAVRLRQARDAILSGQNLAETEATLSEAGNWLAHMAEPHFLLGLVNLLRGDAVQGAAAIGRRPESQGQLHQSLGTLDPVETAWLLLIARLIGHEALEAAMREQAAGARHVALRRSLWLLDGMGEESPDLLSRLPGDLLSIHWLGEEDFTGWCDLVRRVLAANPMSNGLAALSRRLAA